MFNDKESSKIFEISKINKYNKKKSFKQYNTIYLAISIMIIILLLIEIIKLKIKLNDKGKTYKNSIHYDDIKYIDTYKLFQLYIENRTEFYIRGRQIHMRSIGSDYNDSNIRTIQDKFNWLLVHDSPELKTDIVDKVLLRNYSRKILGKDICVPLIKIYKNVDEINLDELPEQFVLKCNHGSAMNIICNNKSNFDINKAKTLLNNWMSINYGLIKYEYQYLNIKKKIFAERFLMNNLTDYKFYCFNGFPKLIKVQAEFKNGRKMYHYYDENWKITNIETNLGWNIRLPEIKFPKPKHFDLMIKYAKEFAKDFLFVRVDLYEFNDTIYLSELTFTPANVLSPFKDESQRLYLGSLLNLSQSENFSNN